MSASVRTYYELTKPGIIYGNVMTTIAGYLFASKWHIAVQPFLAVIVGVSLVIAGACVTNNYIDRGIDKKMARTKKRALVTGEISGRSAITYAAVLALAGFAILITWVNWLTAGIGLVAFIDYVALYGISKRKSVHGTLVGSICGAAPVVAGYTAFANRFDTGAILLFVILVLWQMPHFYAIAMYRFSDYKRAGLPVWPVKKGFHSTKVQIVSYVVAFLLASCLLVVYGYAGFCFLAVMLGLGGIWLWRGVQGFHAKDEVAWARKMFLFSLIVIMGLSAALSVGSLLP